VIIEMLTNVVNNGKKLLVYCQNYEIEANRDIFCQNNGLKSQFSCHRNEPFLTKSKYLDMTKWL